MPYPEVLIIGRPNVGKSTFFNRLVGKNLALVDNQPGSTRDFKTHEVEWQGVTFLLTDSGGWVPGEKDSIASKVGQKLDEKINQAPVLVMLVDALEGLSPSDDLVIRHLRKKGVQPWLVINKVDEFSRKDELISDFTTLGFRKVFPISALHGIGIDDFLDELILHLPAPKPLDDQSEDPDRPIRIAILGKPNVGKSSLANALLGENRLLVDDLAGTTHDAIPVIIETPDSLMTVVDTAGIRLSKQQDSRIEKMSVEQALFELQTCQVAVLLVDGEKGITHQDVTISRIIHEAFRPVVILINKWDIHPLGAEQARAERITRRELRLLYFAPVLFISAKTGQGLEKVLPTVNSVFEESCKEVSTSKVNAALQSAVSKQNPPFRKGNQVKILYGYQRKGHPPAIEIFVRHAECMAPSYLRFLEDEMRVALGLERCPLHLALKEKPEEGEVRRPSYRRNFDPNIKIRKDRIKKQVHKTGIKNFRKKKKK